MIPTPLAPLALAECEIHVWTTQLSAGPQPEPELLDEKERARALALRSPARRRRWVTARGRLRAVLARYLGQPAQRIAIGTGEHGKPELRAPDAAPLRFNLSHSGDLALYVVAAREVGVDVERLRAGTDVVRLARRMLGEEAAGALERADSHERAPRFFAAWARHEARLKCLGTGLEGGGHPVAGARPVTVLDLAIDRGYAAAIALEGALALSRPESVADELAAVPACRLEILRWSAR